MDRGKALMGVLGGLLSGLALMAGTFAVLRSLRTPPPAAAKQPGLLRVTLRSAAPGAQIFLDGERCGSNSCEAEVKPGVHQAEARKPGFASSAREFTARKGEVVELTLQPLPAAVEVTSDLSSGQLRLDGKPVDIAGGAARLDEISPGEHLLRFTSGAFFAEIAFESQPGAPPRLLKPPQVRGLRAIAVSGAGPLARLWVSDHQAELAIGARELGFVPPEGLALPALDRGVHRFRLRLAPGAESEFAYEIAESPTAWISLRTNRRLGTLRVSTGVDDARILLDGKPVTQATKRGLALLLAAPGPHEVRVEKAGFLAPPAQKATVREGSEIALDFRLEPVPRRGSVQITGAAAGAALAIDGKQAATADSYGMATIGDLDPGARVLTARREGFVPGRWELAIAAGRNPAFRAAMQRAPASLRIALLPAGVNAKASLRRMGEFEERTVAADTALALPEGVYTVSAVDAHGKRTVTQVRLEAGKEAVASLTLGAATAKTEPVAAPKLITLDDWKSVEGWTAAGQGRLEKQGGGILLAPTRASAQSLTFTAHVRPGKPVRWVTQFRDADNYTFYEFNGGSLQRSELIAGKSVPRNSALHGGHAGTVRIRMTQQGAVLRTSAFLGGQWVDLDTADAPSGSGRFGFYLPGRDRLALSEFRYEHR